LQQAHLGVEMREDRAMWASGSGGAVFKNLEDAVG
jgi:hypothetical protein